MMEKQHVYEATVKWTGNTGTGTSAYTAYERSHVIYVQNKQEIKASSDPSFRGDPTKHNPEELFLSSISSCHMLWYLHLCAVAGVVVVGYTDTAKAVMQETADGGGHFSSVTLCPHVVVKEAAMIQKASDLHKEANRFCFIANSCNFPVSHIPVVTSKRAGQTA